MSKPQKPRKSKKKARVTPPERFANGVLLEAAMRLRTARKPPELLTFFDFTQGDTYVANHIEILSQDGKLYWAIVQQGTNRVMGGGWFVFRTRPERCLEEARAALKLEYRGKGIYPEVLKALRKLFGRPLVSDRQLSAANRKAWLKLGAKVMDDHTKRLRINPPTLTLDEQWGLAWLLTEGDPTRDLIEYARKIKALARRRAIAEGARTDEEIAMNYVATLRLAVAKERRRLSRKRSQALVRKKS